MNDTHQVDHSTIVSFLKNLIIRELSTEGKEWLNQKLDLIQRSSQKKDIYLAFSTASRYTGKEELTLTDEELEEARQLRTGFDLSGWSIDQAVRILLVLSMPHSDYDFFSKVLKQLFETAEVSELTALYLGLPLYPYPEELTKRAIEGFRTNINTVFNAIALNNPFPKDYLNEAEWNQMVLKAVFIGSPLYKIQGIDERANATLAGILIDFAHERWAAGRTVTPELWRCVGPFVSEKTITDLQKVLSSSNDLERSAGALAISSNNFSLGQELLKKHPDLLRRIASKEISWETIGRATENSKL